LGAALPFFDQSPGCLFTFAGSTAGAIFTGTNFAIAITAVTFRLAVDLLFHNYYYLFNLITQI